MTLDGARFREVLGHLPTGVVVITAASSGGRPVGMAVGSFTSVSLDPPLVAFFPDKSSSTFPFIRDSGKFCVNILSVRQEGICRQFAMRGGDKFEGISWTPSRAGAPVIDDVVAWIECDIDRVYDAGDHYIVLARVTDLSVETPTVPLLFFQGGYGGFAATSLAIGASVDMLESLKIADRARTQMEALADEVGYECHAQAVSGSHIVVVSSAYPARYGAAPSPIGLRFPLVPPWGQVFMAWSDEASRERWFEQLGADLERIVLLHSDIEWIRRSGYGLTVWRQVSDIKSVEDTIRKYGQTPATDRELGKLMGEVGSLAHLDRLRPVSYKYPSGTVATLSAPVFGPSGELLLMLSLHNVPMDAYGPDVASIVDLLNAAAATVTRSIA